MTFELHLNWSKYPSVRETLKKWEKKISVEEMVGILFEVQYEIAADCKDRNGEDDLRSALSRRAAVYSAIPQAEAEALRFVENS